MRGRFIRRFADLRTWVFLPAILFVVLAAFLAATCSAQSDNHRSRPEPKQDATAAELFEYVRSALLLLSPDDGFNDNLEVTYDWNKNVMTISQPGGHCDLYLNALNTNDVAWDIFDPSDSHETRDKLVRLTMVSISNTKARTCYDKMGTEDDSVPTNRIRLLFSYTKADQWPGFQAKLAKALKHLIVMTGGTPPKDLFQR